MPFTKSGLWVPYDPSRRVSPLRAFTLPVIVSVASVGISILSLWITRYNTQVAMRSYLTYKTTVPNENEVIDQLKTGYHDPCPAFAVEITNAGNTPAYHVSHSFWGDDAVNFKGDRGLAVPIEFDLGPKEVQLVDASVCFHEISKPPGPFLFTIIEAEVRYLDVFNRRHTDRLCYSVFIGEKPVLRPCGREEVESARFEGIVHALRSVFRLN